MKTHTEKDKYEELRRKAKDLLEISGVDCLENPEINIKEILEEFSIYQIELELQNEELIKITSRLEASQKYLENLFTHAPVGYIVLNSEGLIKDANSAAARLFEISHFALKGLRFKSFIPYHHLVEYNNCFTEMLSHQTKQSLEICFRVKADRSFWAKTDMQIMAQPDSDEMTVLCALTDISKEKESAELLRQHRDELEQKVKSRTTDLREANEKLIEEIRIREETAQIKSLMEAELLKAKKIESVGHLAGGIAHDFNNLLSVILGNIEMVREEAFQSTVYHYLGEAEKACMRGKELTSRLITFSSGGAPVKKVGHIAALLETCCRLSLSGSNIQCENSIPNDLWMIKFDEFQMRHAIHNVIQNAVDSMPEGGVISLTAENIVLQNVHSTKSPYHSDDSSEPVQNHWVQITIQDHGNGISEENLPLIFDPYFTTKEIGYEKGMGLGLSIAYSIISKHNGQIIAESSTGLGTTIRILLPASAEPVTPEIPKQVPSVHPAKKTKTQKKILILEDEEMVRNLMKRMLNKLGYLITLSEAGIEAIELFQKAMDSGEPFDAVILDLTIRGGMGGKEVINKLKAIDPKVRAIIASGYDHHPVMVNYDDYGFCGMLVKPYGLEDIKVLLERIFEMN